MFTIRHNSNTSSNVSLQISSELIFVLILSCESFFPPYLEYTHSDTDTSHHSSFGVSSTRTNLSNLLNIKHSENV